MADSVRDRYQRAMSVPSTDLAGLGMKGFNEGLMRLATAMRGSDKGKATAVSDPMPAYQAPYTGLHNEPYGANGLPPFEQPGSSLPMQNYMPQAVTEPHGVMPAPGGQMQPQPIAPQPAPMTQQASFEPVPQIGDPKVLALIEAMAKPKPAPWAINEGNFMDQYGG